ncbi:MAG TPA: hypothetical protein VF388_08025 [Lacunisphaera sp.]
MPAKPNQPVESAPAGEIVSTRVLTATANEQNFDRLAAHLSTLLRIAH